MSSNKLTAKQIKFIEAYSGNGVEAAKLAGYKGNDNTLAQVAHENLRKPEIADAIKSREKSRTSKLIATREERQIFWTEMFRDKELNPKWRLMASELLGRSEADFTENVKHGINQELAEWVREIRTKDE